MVSEDYIEDDDNYSEDEANIEFGVQRVVTMVSTVGNMNAQAAVEFIRDERWLEEIMGEGARRQEVEEETTTEDNCAQSVEDYISHLREHAQGVDSDIIIGEGKEDQRQEDVQSPQIYGDSMRDVGWQQEIIFQSDKRPHHNSIRKRKRDYQMIRKRSKE